MKKRSFKKHLKSLFLSLLCVVMLGVSTIPTQAASNPTIWYCSHVSTIGWMQTVTNGDISGTTGRGLQMEALQIDLTGLDGALSYRAHVADRGWLGWVTNRQTAGTTGLEKRLEAFQVKLTGNAAQSYDVVYRAHVQNIGWMDWVKNGETAGTTGRSLRIEAIQINVQPKTAPFPTPVPVPNPSNKSTVLNNPTVQSFLNDSRWKVGTLFNNNVTGKLSQTKGLGWGCNAYARDFVYTLYKKALHEGQKYTSISEIRAGDVLYVTPQHWMIVLERNGNNLDIIHGNWTAGKVCRSVYTLNGTSIGGVKTFSYGYHY